MIIKPEGYLFQVEDMEKLYHVMRQNRIIDAQIVSVAYPEDTPTWVATFKEYPDVRGYIPASESGINEISESLMQRMVGLEINVKIKAIDKEHKILACSRKEAVETAEKLLKENLIEGQIIPVIVKAILPSTDNDPAALLVDISGGYLVKVEAGQAKRKLSQTLKNQYTPGQNIKVMVTATDPISVSVKKAYPSPWEQARSYERGQSLSGTVVDVKIVNNNSIVFIEPDLTPGLTGIASYPLEGQVSIGDRLACFVANCIPEEEKLRLRIRGYLK